MKRLTFFILTLMTLSCQQSSKENSATESPSITGSWQLVSGTLIEKGDTTITYYTGNKSFIKIISPTHFAFMGHDLTKGKDSTAFYTSGGGTYILKDSLYTEHLEYCIDRQWEGNDFSFTVRWSADSLVQEGREKVEAAGVDRINIEKYRRIK